jgi:hypothetical protein
VAGFGKARKGVAGLARRGMSPQRLVRHRRLGLVRRGAVRFSKASQARLGMARIGAVRSGEVSRGMAGMAGMARRGKARHGVVWSGGERYGRQR